MIFCSVMGAILSMVAGVALQFYWEHGAASRKVQRDDFRLTGDEPSSPRRIRVNDGGALVGDDRAEALRVIQDEHAPALWRYVVRLTGDRALADDIVQEVMLRAWRRPGDPRPVARARPGPGSSR